MRKPSIQIAAITRENRLTATDVAKDAIAACGGWIEDFQLFSNKMTCIRFELPAAALPALTGRLVEAHIRVDADASACPDGAPPPSADVRVALQITFIHDEPDFRREVLAVPG